MKKIVTCLPSGKIKAAQEDNINLSYGEAQIIELSELDSILDNVIRVPPIKWEYSDLLKFASDLECLLRQHNAMYFMYDGNLAFGVAIASRLKNTGCIMLVPASKNLTKWIELY